MNTLVHYLKLSAEKYSANLAITYQNQSINYAELYKRAFDVSLKIITNDVTIGDRICICLPKSIELYVSIYGALLAKCCYVPVEYTAPKERLIFVIKDSNVKIFISKWKKIKYLYNSKLTSQFNFSNEDIIICHFTRKNSNVNFYPFVCGYNVPELKNTSLLPQVVEQDMASILYTSGTTGYPKGVVHTHGSIIAFVNWASQHLALQSTDNIAQFSAIGFDLSVFDIFSALMVGANLIPVPEFYFSNMLKLCDFIRKKNITIWYSVPSVFLRAIDIPSWKKISSSSLRHIIFAGESIPKKTLINFYNYISDFCTMHNWYGPTETNVCTYYVINKNDFIVEGSIPIGSPCPYSEVYFKQDDIGDSCFELYVAGSSNMKGYWNMPIETSHVIFEFEGKHFYKTRDFVKKNSDGLLVFLGRKDKQVKLNGYRIQLEEIELYLERHQGIFKAIVLTMDIEINRGMQLIAAVIPQKGYDLLTHNLFKYCADFFPNYMIPSRFVLFDKIPVTKRGKLDYAKIEKRILADKAGISSQNCTLI